MKTTAVTSEKSPTISNLSDELIYFSLKNLPDFERFPLPKFWYDKFKIIPPKIPTIKEALKLHYETQLAYLNNPEAPKVEIRPPAEGGVRPLLEGEVPEIKIIPGKTLEDIDLSGNLIDETPQSEESK
jgi:hypothetical protein